MPDDQGEFIAKLRQIEDYAATAGAEAQVGSVKNYLRQIGLTARTLRLRLEMGATIAVARAEEPSDSEKKRRA